MGVNGTLFLLRILERSYDLIEGAIDTYNRKKVIQFAILIRAHFETTTNLAYFLINLEKFYRGDIHIDKINEIVGKLLIGSRKKPEGNPPLEMPDSVSVLTAINGADNLLKNMGSDISMFEKIYELLCEFSHPNFLGTAYKTKVNIDKGNVTFLTDEESFERYSKMNVSRLLISVNFFIFWYKKAFSLIEKNETMPTLVKS